MDIKKDIKITVKQKDVEQALIRMIKEQDPTIKVDKIHFKAKRNSEESIEVKIEASLGGINAKEETIEIEDTVTGPVLHDTTLCEESEPDGGTSGGTSEEHQKGVQQLISPSKGLFS